MPIPDVPSISYGTTDNMVYDWQVLDMDLLWQQQTKRVNDWLDKTELYKSRTKSMIKASAKNAPQVCSLRSRRYISLRHPTIRTSVTPTATRRRTMRTWT